jgi:hypothetical protein
MVSNFFDNWGLSFAKWVKIAISKLRGLKLQVYESYGTKNAF